MFRKELVDAGTTFSNYFVTDSLCCPSRSTTLRGQYIHNHHVTTNLPPQGGFETFHSNGDERSTMATWLRGAGYHTGLFGKYLNGYPHTASPDFVPPGWDEWSSPNGGNAYTEYDYTLNVNGRQVRHGAEPADYLVDVLADQTVSFIRRNADRPYLAYVAPFVPHQPATPPPRYEGMLGGATAPRTASFNEADVSDKPAWERDRPRLPQPAVAAIDTLYRRRRLTMLAIDDMVGRIVAALRSSGQLDNTYLVFSSDNGFHLGQHRLPAGKQTPYEEDIHVPLVVRGPGVPAGATVDRMALNTDLAPTFARIGGAFVPSFVDGRSLLPLLRPGAPATGRRSLLIEHDGRNNTPNNSALQRRARARGSPGTAPADPDADATVPTRRTRALGSRINLLVAIPTYAALRTDRYLYVEYATGEKELYDLLRDPAELDNIASGTPTTVLRAFGYRLHQLVACRAESCRAAEDLPTPSAP